MQDLTAPPKRGLRALVAGIDFNASAREVAEALLGATLLVDGVGGAIVETEAYDQDDEASHSFRGPTARNRSMFGSPARAYVYRSRGLHWCLNLVCGAEGSGAAVLVRALEPARGIARMAQRRGVSDLRLLCSGPGRQAQALGVDGSLDGADLAAAPFELAPRSRPLDGLISRGPRVGVSKAAQIPWRFGLRSSPFLSRRFT